MPNTATASRPDNWVDKHSHLYNKFRGRDSFDLLRELLKYRNAEGDPKLKQFPPEMVEKTIEVLEFILENEREMDIALAIEQAISVGAIP